MWVCSSISRPVETDFYLHLVGSCGSLMYPLVVHSHLKLPSLLIHNWEQVPGISHSLMSGKKSFIKFFVKCNKNLECGIPYGLLFLHFAIEWVCQKSTYHPFASSKKRTCQIERMFWLTFHKFSRHTIKYSNSTYNVFFSYSAVGFEREHTQNVTFSTKQ